MLFYYEVVVLLLKLVRMILLICLIGIYVSVRMMYSLFSPYNIHIVLIFLLPVYYFTIHIFTVMKTV